MSAVARRRRRNSSQSTAAAPTAMPISAGPSETTSSSRASSATVSGSPTTDTTRTVARAFGDHVEAADHGTSPQLAPRRGGTGQNPGEPFGHPARKSMVGRWHERDRSRRRGASERHRQRAQQLDHPLGKPPLSRLPLQAARLEPRQRVGHAVRRLDQVVHVPEQVGVGMKPGDLVLAGSRPSGSPRCASACSSVVSSPASSVPLMRGGRGALRRPSRSRRSRNSKARVRPGVPRGCCHGPSARASDDLVAIEPLDSADGSYRRRERQC